MAVLVRKMWDPSPFVVPPAADPHGVKLGMNLSWCTFTKRYLYFACASALLRRQRHIVEGWWHEVADYATKEMWMRMLETNMGRRNKMVG